jgi:hypothetical protein
MPDYDPKSIPILDDIIEDDIANDDKAEPELTGSESADVENQDSGETAIDNLDLFASDTLDIEQETMEPSLGTIDQFINPADDGLTAIETDTPESALIDFHIDQDEPDINVEHDTPQLEDIPDSDETFDEITIGDTASDPIPPVTLDAIVDDVVKQLIPELEQQLRHLVQQALEEKLPEEIVEQLSTDKND